VGQISDCLGKEAARPYAVLKRGIGKMSLRQHVPALFLAIALAGTAFGTAPQDSPKQDMKDAGHETKNAAKDAGRGTKNAAKKTGHAVKHTTKKAAHKTASKTEQGAQEVKDKTDPN
jgi:hypothetical protein